MEIEHRNQLNHHSIVNGIPFNHYQNVHFQQTTELMPAIPVLLDEQIYHAPNEIQSTPIIALESPLEPKIQKIQTSSEKLDETFDIVCQNVGLIKEPSSFTNLTVKRTKNAKFNKITAQIETKHVCSLCNKPFSAQRYYKQHFNSVHLHSGPKQFKCMLCQRSFHTEIALKKHIDHEMYKPYNCDECDRTFNRKPDLIRHLFVHQKSKPFICTACQKSFIRADQLSSHHKNCTLKMSNETDGHNA